MFSIIRNDITKVAADAVVTTANPEPAIGAGLEYAVYETAGFEQLLPDRSRLGYLKTGNVAVTPAYGLPARCLIHAVAPRWTGSSDDIPLLCSCYRNALKTRSGLVLSIILFVVGSFLSLGSGLTGWIPSRSHSLGVMITVAAVFGILCFIYQKDNTE